MKRIACILVALLCLVSVFMPLKSNAGGEMKKELKTFIEWNRVRKYSDLPTDTNHTYYMFLAWTSDNGNPSNLSASSTTGYVLTAETGYCKDYNDYVKGACFPNSNYSKVFFLDKDKFITTSPYQMPRIYYAGTDGDNGSVPKYKIRLNAGNGSYIDRDDDEFDFNSSGAAWGVAVYGGGKTSYEKSAEHSGCVSFFYNEKGGGIDEGFMFHGDKLCAEEDKDYDDFDPFIMWVGKEVTYSVVTQDYAVMPGEVFSIKDRLVINNGVTVTVYPGAIFSIDGTVINNGTIKNYGTVIVEEKKELFPIVMGRSSVNDAGFIDSNSNTIYCYGSKTKVTPPGYKKPIIAEGVIINKGNIGFGKGMGGLYLYDGSALENMGFLLTADSFRVENSLFINTGKAAIGLSLKNISEVWGYDSKNYPIYLLRYYFWGFTTGDYLTFSQNVFDVTGNSVLKNKTGKVIICGENSDKSSHWSK